MKLKESETEEFVKELAVIRVNEEEEMGELPECLTFFEMYGIHTLEELKAKRTMENASDGAKPESSHWTKRQVVKTVS